MSSDVGTDEVNDESVERTRHICDKGFGGSQRGLFTSLPRERVVHVATQCSLNTLHDKKNADNEPFSHFILLMTCFRAGYYSFSLAASCGGVGLCFW